MKTDELKPELALPDPETVSDELLPEYRFDYSKARPNRFAARLNQTRTGAGGDVAAMFTSRRPSTRFCGRSFRPCPKPPGARRSNTAA